MVLPNSPRNTLKSFWTENPRSDMQQEIIGAIDFDQKVWWVFDERNSLTAAESTEGVCGRGGWGGMGRGDMQEDEKVIVRNADCVISRSLFWFTFSLNFFSYSYFFSASSLILSHRNVDHDGWIITIAMLRFPPLTHPDVHVLNHWCANRYMNLKWKRNMKRPLAKYDIVFNDIVERSYFFHPNLKDVVQ